jgi:CheY-like chemotaxis protein
MNSKKISILVVDDEEDIRSMIRDVLRTQNYECTTAENGKEAFEAICSKKIDVVISDVIMPELGGIALLDKVKKRNILLPHLALISGFTETPLADIYDKGAEAFLAKPFEISTLLTTLDHLLKPMETWSEEPFSEEGNQERVFKCTFSSMEAATNEKRLILGRGGCFLDSKHLSNFPSVGTKVRFHFDFEKKDHAAIHGQGTVRWVRKNKQSEYAAGLGIEFDILDKNSRIEFLEDVKKIQTTAFIPKG